MDALMNEYEIKRLLVGNESLRRQIRLLTREQSVLYMENRQLMEDIQKQHDLTRSLANLNNELDETNTIKERMVEMETEIVNLSQVNDTLTNELKRKRDHVVGGPVPIVENNPVEMKKCTACQHELPLSTFTERNKKKNTKGEIKIYYPVSNTCRACRRQKYTATKKPKIDA